jgi:raffinose/stachyose/melibiose transport system permease protein
MFTNQKLKNIKKIRRITFYVLLLIISLLFIYPLVYTIFSSLKNNNEIYTNYFGFPTTIRIENYVKALTTGSIGIAFRNSLFLTFVTVTMQLFLSSMAAFAITRIKFKLSYPLLLFFSLGMMIPIQSILIPIATLSAQLNLSDNYIGLLSVYIAGGIPYCVFIMAGYMHNLPKEIEEAAIIDGCSVGRVYWSIDLVLSKPIIVTMGIIAFLGTWNELIVALVLINKKSLQTLPISLLSFSGQFSVDWGTLCAAIMIAVIPTIVVYILFQNNVERGLSEGGIKG